jgi:hypothetical protein
MKKRYFFLWILPFIVSCSFGQTGLKQLDLNSFKIVIPSNWQYIKLQGEDSFIGLIKTAGKNSQLNFDFSTFGYANSLLSTEEDYIKSGEWNRGYFYKVGVTYTSDFDVKNERLRQMKKLGTTDSTRVRVEADPSYKTKIFTHQPTKQEQLKYPKADYIADLTYNNSTIHVPIEVPLEIKSHNIQIDTTEKYIVKTISPKIAGKGITGIFIRSRSSSLNFQMNGKNLSDENQKLALEAFKTITFKK